MGRGLLQLDGCTTTATTKTLENRISFRTQAMHETALTSAKQDLLGSCVHDTPIQTQTPKGGDESGSKLHVSLEEVLSCTRKIGLLDDLIVEVAHAVFISKALGRSNPLWVMFVGNPSSNKTQMVSLFSQAQDVYELDTLTANPFVSGIREKEKPHDLLPKLDGKCLIIKDYTPLFGLHEETVKKIISELVAIYDGKFRKHSSSRGSIGYQATFSHIGCITPMGLSMRQTYMNRIGARFLTIHIPALGDDARKKCFKIAWSDELQESITAATKASSAFVTSICEGIRTNGVQLSPVAEELRQEINLLAELVACARGEVRTRTQKFKNEEGEEISYQEIEDIQVEEPFRAMHQLKTLCRSLAIIRGKTEVTSEEVKAAKRVALSSMPVHRAEALSAFTSTDKLSANDVAEKLGKNYKTMKRHLDQLAHLKVLTTEKAADGKTTLFYPDPRFVTLIITDTSNYSPISPSDL